MDLVHFIAFKNMLLIFKNKFAKFSKISKIWFSIPKNTKLATLQNTEQIAKKRLEIQNQRPKISGNQSKILLTSDIALYNWTNYL